MSRNERSPFRALTQIYGPAVAVLLGLVEMREARDSIICTCGSELSKDAKFCSVCGKRMEDIINNHEADKEVVMKECICGAKVPEGQFMCLECGRKIED